MTAPAKNDTGTAITRTEGRRMLDVEGAKASKRFLDAYTTGKIDRLSPDEQAMFLFALGERLGVKAELGELMLYQGKPYITIDGRVRLAHESGLLAGMDVRPATAMERRDYGCEETDALWVCLAYRRGSSRGFKGWGHVTKADKNPVAKQFPREMAKKRAKYDALRLAFPPAEHVSEMHERYIEEAEAEIRAQQPVAHRLMAGEYAEEIEETREEQDATTRATGTDEHTAGADAASDGENGVRAGADEADTPPAARSARAFDPDPVREAATQQREIEGRAAQPKGRKGAHEMGTLPFDEEPARQRNAVAEGH